MLIADSSRTPARSEAFKSLDEDDIALGMLYGVLDRGIGALCCELCEVDLFAAESVVILSVIEKAS